MPLEFSQIFGLKQNGLKCSNTLLRYQSHANYPGIIRSAGNSVLQIR